MGFTLLLTLTKRLTLLPKGSVGFGRYIKSTPTCWLSRVNEVWFTGVIRHWQTNIFRARFIFCLHWAIFPYLHLCLSLECISGCLPASDLETCLRYNWNWCMSPRRFWLYVWLRYDPWSWSEIWNPRTFSQP